MKCVPFVIASRVRILHSSEYIPIISVSVNFLNIFYGRLNFERQERQSSAEIDRLNSEISSLRTRLERSDSDLLQARREQLRLNEQISSLEKDVSGRNSNFSLFKSTLSHIGGHR